jgi:cyclase
VHDRGLVKTVGFSAPKYVGDPINAVKIFNEKGVDELIIVDIDASVRGEDPDYRMIETVAAESRMPLCYGGGVTTPEQAKTIIGLGVEKVAISSAALANPALIGEVAEAVGIQSTVAVLDVKLGKDGQYTVWTHNGLRHTGRSPRSLAVELARRGAGEIVLNSIDRDGRMKGYDLDLVQYVRDAINVPLTVLGGAGNLNHIGELIARFGVVGAAAGSMFVFKGVYRAVLINYPSAAERDRLFRDFLSQQGSSSIYSVEQTDIL